VKAGTSQERREWTAGPSLNDARAIAVELQLNLHRRQGAVIGQPYPLAGRMALLAILKQRKQPPPSAELIFHMEALVSIGHPPGRRQLLSSIQNPYTR